MTTFTIDLDSPERAWSPFLNWLVSQGINPACAQVVTVNPETMTAKVTLMKRTLTGKVTSGSKRRYIRITSLPPRREDAELDGLPQRLPLPDPSIIRQGRRTWVCPLCGDCTERWGVERRRFGRIPWKRLVHVDCGVDRDEEREAMHALLHEIVAQLNIVIVTPPDQAARLEDGHGNFVLLSPEAEGWLMD